MKKIFSITGIIALLVVSCTTERVEYENPENTIQSDAQKALEILKKDGHNTHNAIIQKESIILEGDILIDIPNLLETYEKFQSSYQSKQNLSHDGVFSGGKLTSKYVDKLSYSIDDDARAEWLNPLRTAIERFNEVNQCKVQMIFSEGSAFTNISYKELEGAPVGLANLPRLAVNGISFDKKPGPNIYIDPVKTASYGFELKVLLLMHEIGHTIGFEHTFGSQTHKNQYIANVGDFNGTQIQGTTLYDSNSIMYPSLRNVSLAAHTRNDIIALQKLYPGPFISDFNQTITGPRFAVVNESVTYSTSANQTGNSYIWQVNNAGARTWVTLSRSSTLSFNISPEATPNGINSMGVRCIVTKSNGDVSRKTISVTVEGNPTGGGLPK